jgi:hypothetical protein
MPALSNFASLVVDGGPAGLQTGSQGYLQSNFAYVSVTLCVHATTTCQTIDHVQVDTGSVGLRILASSLNSALLSGLPNETDANGDPVGECYGYIDGYAFGSVRTADTQIGGETVASMPLQVIGDTGAFGTVPSNCSTGGGTNLDTLYNLGANGIIGIGTTGTDCGTSCTVAGGYAAAIYYDCPSSGCSSVIARAASTTAPFQQLPNPVAAMSVDNNGSFITFPSVAAGGATTLSGTLYFGIGTETNNALGSATELTTTLSTDADGSGLITAVFNGQSLPDSFIDSGSSIYFFEDASVPQCAETTYAGYYCPASPVGLTPTLQGQNGASASAAFTLYNAETLLSTNNSALPGIGGSPKGLGIANPYPTSFDFGLPFFYGRSIYTAIEGKTVGTTAGPFYAF